ncbi:MAG: flippase-like domain-containing protein [Chloroflexi bacterium]|nr:flippase-like domain-containing protein [Chloroflexota bacterium]
MKSGAFRPWMEGERRLRSLRGVGLAISALALVVVLASMDMGEAVRLIGQAKVSVLALGLGPLLVQLVIRATRWQILLPRRADGRPVHLSVAGPALLVGYLGNAMLPLRLGEPIRAAIVARKERLDFLECFGATLTERVVDTATLAVGAFVAAVSLGTTISILAVTGTAAAAGLVILGLLVTVGLSRTTLAITRRLRDWVGSLRVDPIADRAVAFAQGVDRGRSPRRLLAVAALSCLCWGLDALVFWLVAQAIDVPLSVPAAVLVAGMTVLVTAIPAAPGYVGTYELAATSTAAALGVPGAEALAVAVLAHILTTVPLALGGVVALGISGARWPRRAGGPRWPDVTTAMSSTQMDTAGPR